MPSHDSQKTVLVYGFGAVGILYSHLLTQAGYQVTAIARSNYALVQDGVTIKSSKFGLIEKFKPARLVSDYRDAVDTSYNYLICCFKSVPEGATACNGRHRLTQSSHHDGAVP